MLCERETIASAHAGPLHSTLVDALTAEVIHTRVELTGTAVALTDTTDALAYPVFTGIQ